MRVMPGILSHSDVAFLPIVAAFVKEIGVAEEVDRLCAMESDVRPGVVVMAMILDTLSGRCPLYRFERFLFEQDTELLLGERVDAALGRVLLRIYEVGTGPLLTAVCLTVHKLFELDMSHVHHDTTNRARYGDYDLYDDPDHKRPFVITNGFNKDHRPDLKQMIHSLLCVDHGIPIRNKVELPCDIGAICGYLPRPPRGIRRGTLRSAALGTVSGAETRLMGELPGVKVDSHGPPVAGSAIYGTVAPRLSCNCGLL